MIISKKVWKQLVVDYFRVLFWHMPGGNEEAYENLDQNGDCPNQGLNSGTPKYEPERYITQSTCMQLLYKLYRLGKV
jgi:hypothetical protein